MKNKRNCGIRKAAPAVGLSHRGARVWIGGAFRIKLGAGARSYHHLRTTSFSSLYTCSSTGRHQTPLAEVGGFNG